jgi:phosphoribosylglycinamide formyltransferase-1
MDAQGEQFVSEPIQPVAGTGRASSAAIGEPGLPGRFVWRDRTYRVVGVLKKWKRSGPCRHGSGEMYLRRHYYRIRTDPAMVMTLYCERQARNRSKPKARWFVYTVAEVDASGGPLGSPEQSDRLQASRPHV